MRQGPRLGSLASPDTPFPTLLLKIVCPPSPSHLQPLPGLNFRDRAGLSLLFEQDPLSSPHGYTLDRLLPRRDLLALDLLLFLGAIRQ